MRLQSITFKASTFLWAWSGAFPRYVGFCEGEWNYGNNQRYISLHIFGMRQPFPITILDFQSLWLRLIINLSLFEAIKVLSLKSCTWLWAVAQYYGILATGYPMKTWQDLSLMPWLCRSLECCCKSDEYEWHSVPSSNVLWGLGQTGRKVARNIIKGTTPRDFVILVYRQSSETSNVKPIFSS